MAVEFQLGGRWPGWQRASLAAMALQQQYSCIEGPAAAAAAATPPLNSPAE
ncbi:hypothetical protein JYU34_002786 [Plutella xylostella]|uniref:Uncharacterized protein n=1 Tax=Plutella xylostella TaxID=51655 RepID=A0ABQ7R352_PLUXY|nr:hypothetical protein JYU34_002786 [Plutella xylostella]